MVNLNLRAGRSLDDRVLLTIPRGSRVEVLASHRDWSLVRYEDLVGWSKTAYLEPDAAESVARE